MGRWSRLTVSAVSLVSVALMASALLDSSGSGALVDVTVAPGDSLWAIARTHAPSRDARAVIEEIRQLNVVGEGPLPVGVVLRVPAGP